MPLNTRRHERKKVRINASLLTDKAAPHSCRIVDISSGGARLMIDRSYSQSELIKIQMAGKETLSALIAWQKERYMGIMFI